MKITKRSLAPVVAVAIIALGAGTLIINNQHTKKAISLMLILQRPIHKAQKPHPTLTW